MSTWGDPASHLNATLPAWPEIYGDENKHTEWGEEMAIDPDAPVWGKQAYKNALCLDSTQQCNHFGHICARFYNRDSAVGALAVPSWTRDTPRWRPSFPRELSVEIMELMTRIPQSPPLLQKAFTEYGAIEATSSLTKVSRHSFQDAVENMRQWLDQTMTVSSAWRHDLQPFYNQALDICTATDLVCLAKRLQILSLLQTQLSQDRLISDAEALSLDCKANLRYVRRLVIHTGQRNETLLEIGWTLGRAIAQVVRACPRLEQLILLDSGAMEWHTFDVLEAMKTLPVNSLKSFSFDGNDSVRASHLGWILAYCPSLEEFNMGSPETVDAKQMVEVSRALEGRSLALVSLMWRMTSGERQFSQLLTTLHLPRLKNVMISRAPDQWDPYVCDSLTQAFAVFLQVYGRQLQFLQVELAREENEIDNEYVREWLELCPNLQDFVFDPLVHPSFPKLSHQSLRRIGFIHFFKASNSHEIALQLHILERLCRGNFPQLTTFRCFDGEPMEHATTTTGGKYHLREASAGTSDRMKLAQGLVKPALQMCKQYGKRLEHARGQYLQEHYLLEGFLRISSVS